MLIEIKYFYSLRKKKNRKRIPRPISILKATDNRMMIYNVKVTKQNVNYCFFFFFLAVIILIFTSGINTYLGVEISRDTVCASSV